MIYRQDKSAALLLYTMVNNGAAAKDLMAWGELTKEDMLYHYRLGELIADGLDNLSAECQAQEFVSVYLDLEQSFVGDQMTLYAHARDFADGLFMGNHIELPKGILKDFAALYERGLAKSRDTQDKDVVFHIAYAMGFASSQIHMRSVCAYRGVDQIGWSIEKVAEVFDMPPDVAACYLERGRSMFADGRVYAQQRGFCRDDDIADFADLYVCGLDRVERYRDLVYKTRKDLRQYAVDFATGAMFERTHLLSLICGKDTTLKDVLEQVGSGDNVLERYIAAYKP